MNSLAGRILVAPPDLHDPDFAKAVILVVQHSEEQAFGVILNRPTDRTIRDAWGGTKRPECYQWVYSGGPVPGPLFALHGDPSLAEIEVLPGVYYVLQKKNLERLLGRPGRTFKIFNSHAGWGPGQLERWIEAGRWAVAPATPRLVFDADTSLWEEAAKLA
jgi:putative transcriptional regulator